MNEQLHKVERASDSAAGRFLWKIVLAIFGVMLTLLLWSIKGYLGNISAKADSRDVQVQQITHDQALDHQSLVLLRDTQKEIIAAQKGLLMQAQETADAVKYMQASGHRERGSRQ